MRKLCQVYDKLLYHCMGNESKTEAGADGKIGGLLHPQSSLIGQTNQRLLDLIRQYGPRPNRRNEWLALRAMGCDLASQEFAKATRGKIVRMATQVDRRWGQKFSTWPYPLWKLVGEGFHDIEVVKMMKELFAAAEEELDIYSWGIRQIYNTPEQLRSFVV